MNKLQKELKSKCKVQENGSYLITDYDFIKFIACHNLVYSYEEHTDLYYETGYIPDFQKIQEACNCVIEMYDQDNYLVTFK